MPIIKKVVAREVLDSRGNPTVEVEITTEKNAARAIVPSGASTGIHEALELRDNDKRYHGKGVQKAVAHVNTEIKKSILNKNFASQEELDHVLIRLDNTKNKEKLGANAILGVSMAFCKVQANNQVAEYIAKIAKTKKRMPVPYLNIMNGGKHAGKEWDMQECMIAPINQKSFREGLRLSSEVFHTLQSMLKKQFGAAATLVGDEGGFSPPLSTVEDRLSIIEKALEEEGTRKTFAFALDCAASEYYDKKLQKYRLGAKTYDASALVDYYKDLMKKFNIVSIEDPFHEDDWKAFAEFTKKVGKQVQVVGDDLLCTNPERIQRAIKEKSCNALLLKVNQIGTVTESIQAAKLAMKNNWNVMVSHRSGETEDVFIADLVVGLGTGQCKFGAPSRSERVAKYNQLLRLEEGMKRV